MQVKPYVPTGFAKAIFQSRHALHPEETWEAMSHRVAQAVATAEQGFTSGGEDKRQLWYLRFQQKIDSALFVPGGRILYGAGRPKGQLLNCFVVPVSDSREGWGQCTSDLIIISGMGGGMGVNGTPIRPRGTPVKGAGGIATGAVSFFDILDRVGDVIRMGGGRRVALMLCLMYDHGDIIEFLHKKCNKVDLSQLSTEDCINMIHEELNFRDRKDAVKLWETYNELNDDKYSVMSYVLSQLKEQHLKNANISVCVDYKFMDAVKEDGNVECKWRGEVVSVVKARTIWDLIVGHAWDTGEPGILNAELANDMSNIWYHKPLLSTNPCGEIWLEEYGSCDLGALNLSHHYDPETNDIDEELLKDSTVVAVRFLDNVLDVNTYPLPQIRDNAQNVRRIGLGIMGLADLFVKMGIKYGTQESFDLTERIMSVIKIKAYETSIELAQEKGPFPELNREAFVRSGFCRGSLPLKIRRKIVEHGIRNCALLSIAPTGTISMDANVSSALEPIFAPAYRRRFSESNADATERQRVETIVHPLFKELVKAGKDVSHFIVAHDLSPKIHLEMQYVCQKHVDNAVSKTINLPKEMPQDDLSELLLEYVPKLKGTTLYREGSRRGAPLETLPMEEAKNVVTKEIEAEVAVISECTTGSCDIR